MGIARAAHSGGSRPQISTYQIKRNPSNHRLAKWFPAYEYLMENESKKVKQSPKELT